jgi:hypothetical protein
LLAPLAAFAADPLSTPLVPQHVFGSDYTLCDLKTLADNIIAFAMGFSVIIATIMFAYGGILYVTAPSAGEAQLKKARSVLVNVFIGLVVVLAAWLIVNLTMSVLTGQGMSFWSEVAPNNKCVPNPTYTAFSYSGFPTTTPVQGGGGGTPTGQQAPGTLTQDQAIKKLMDAGVCKTQSECLAGGSLNGIKEQTIDQMIEIHKSCGCDLTITSGVRNDGTPHSTGYKVDIRWNDTLNNWFTSTLGQPAYHPDWSKDSAAYVWTDKCGNVYAHELTPPHLDLGTANGTICSFGG